MSVFQDLRPSRTRAHVLSPGRIPALAKQWMGLVGAALMFGCDGPADQILHMQLPSGQPLATLVQASSDTTIFLIYAPSDCLACGAPLGAWLDWARTGNHRSVQLVLTRPPSPGEQNALRIARVRPAAVLTASSERLQTPSVVVVGPSGTLDAGFGRVEANMIVNRWAIPGPLPPQWRARQGASH